MHRRRKRQELFTLGYALKDSEHREIKQTENTTKTGEKVPHVSSALVLKEEKLLDFLSPFSKQIHFHFLRFVSQH